MSQKSVASSRTNRRPRIHVIRDDGEWSVARNGAKKASRTFRTKQEALSSAKSVAVKRGGGAVVVHAKNGRVSEIRDVGSDGKGTVVYKAKVRAGKTNGTKPRHRR